MTSTPRREIPKNVARGQQIALLGAALRDRFAYRKNVTRYDSTTDDFLEAGAGVCQDFTHLMLALCRLRRIPGRYVSGYLHVERKTAEPSQSHAWIEFYEEIRQIDLPIHHEISARQIHRVPTAQEEAAAQQQ